MRRRRAARVRRSDGRSDAGLVAQGPSRGARPLGEFPRASFEGTYHFDPWWVFRGAGVPARYRNAIVPTNIARSFRAGDVTWKVYDIEFGSQVESVTAIEAKDESFRKEQFTKSTLDLVAAFSTTP